MRDEVTLEALRCDAIVGIEDFEQRAPQPVEITLRMKLDLELCASTGELAASVDYALVTSAVETMVQQGRWRLIECLARAMAGMLLAPPEPVEARAALDAVEVRVRKPTILSSRAVPGVALFRQADDLTPVWRPFGDGVALQVLHEEPTTAAYRVVVDADAPFAVPASVACEVIGGRVWRDDVPLGPTSRFARGSAPRMVGGPRGAVLLWVATAPL